VVEIFDHLKNRSNESEVVENFHNLKNGVIENFDNLENREGEVVKIFDHLNNGVIKNFDNPKIKFSPTNPKAFTEKGLYMLATILKSRQATATTLAIVEAFAKLRELSRAVAALSEAKDKKTHKSLMERSGEIMSELLYSGTEESDTETSLEINLAVMKFKHTVKRKKK